MSINTNTNDEYDDLDRETRYEIEQIHDRINALEHTVSDDHIEALKEEAAELAGTDSYAEALAAREQSEAEADTLAEDLELGDEALADDVRTVLSGLSDLSIEETSPIEVAATASDLKEQIPEREAWEVSE